MHFQFSVATHVKMGLYIRFSDCIVNSLTHGKDKVRRLTGSYKQRYIVGFGLVDGHLNQSGAHEYIVTCMAHTYMAKTYLTVALFLNYFYVTLLIPCTIRGGRGPSAQCLVPTSSTLVQHCNVTCYTNVLCLLGMERCFAGSPCPTCYKQSSILLSKRHPPQRVTEHNGGRVPANTIH